MMLHNTTGAADPMTCSPGKRKAATYDYYREEAVSSSGHGLFVTAVYFSRRHL